MSHVGVFVCSYSLVLHGSLELPRGHTDGRVSKY